MTIVRVNKPAKTIRGYVITFVQTDGVYYEHVTEIYITDIVAEKRFKDLLKRCL